MIKAEAAWGDDAIAASHDNLQLVFSLPGFDHAATQLQDQLQVRQLNHPMVLVLVDRLSRMVHLAAMSSYGAADCLFEHEFRQIPS